MSSTALVPSTQAATQTNTSQHKSSSLSSLSSSSLPTLNLTPKKNAGTPVKPATPRQTGQWTHPRVGEVARRRNATNFDSGNMKSIVYSSGMIVLSLFFPDLLWHTYVLLAHHSSQSIHKLTSFAVYQQLGFEQSTHIPSMPSGFYALLCHSPSPPHSCPSSGHRTLAKTCLSHLIKDNCLACLQ